MALTTTSRISANTTPNFYQDNTGITIDQGYFGVTATSGTVSIVPTTQFTYVNLSNALTGNISLSINATYSLICDKIEVLLTGGASPYVVTYAGDITSTGTTFSATANKYAIYKGTFNGTKFIGSQDVQA